MAEVGILIVDDDVVSQRALKLILDSEGWRVRIVAHPSHAMAELATANWNLAIVNVGLLDLNGTLFATLKELAQAEAMAPDPAPPEATFEPARKCCRALFLVPLMGSKDIPLLLEREGLPYCFKPCHLHDFLQKVSELLLESGAIAESIRGTRGIERKKRSPVHEAQRGQKMFASREDYQMTEEEIAEYEREEREEAERKKRSKQISHSDPL